LMKNEKFKMNFFIVEDPEGNLLQFYNFFQWRVIYSKSLDSGYCLTHGHGVRQYLSARHHQYSAFTATACTPLFNIKVLRLVHSWPWLYFSIDRVRKEILPLSCCFCFWIEQLDPCFYKGLFWLTAGRAWKLV
jgi:hypothetical protein